MSAVAALADHDNARAVDLAKRCLKLNPENEVCKQIVAENEPTPAR